MDAKKLGLAVLKGLGWIAGKAVLLTAVLAISTGTNIAMDHDGFVPIRVDVMEKANVPDFDLENVYIIGETEHSVLLWWNGLKFEVEDTPEWDFEMWTPSNDNGGGNFLPTSTTGKSEYASPWDGKIPQECMYTPGKLSYRGWVPRLSLELPAMSEDNDQIVTCTDWQFRPWPTWN